MAFTLSSVAAKDGNSATIAGGLLAADKAGGGVGPFIMAHLLVDGVAGTNLATVKAASTPAVATDPALVVAVSPNNAIAATQSGAWNVGQTGTWTVQPGNTANTTPWKVDASAAAVPLAAGSAIVGKVGIDQTTHGTTDKVAADLYVGGAASDKGPGTSGTATQRIIIDSSQMGSLGQTTMSASAPVAIASDQSPVKTYPLVAAAANGETSSRVNAAASTNATSLKASAGNIVNIDVFNVAAYDVYLKLYNKASAPTVGTDTPVWTIPIKSGQGFARTFPSGGKSFATGIAYAITKLQADSDTTAVVAGDLTGAVDWI